MVKTKDTDMPLSKTETEVYTQQLISEWKNQVRTAMETSFKNKEITIGSNTMKLAWTVYGEKPQDGYPLYIFQWHGRAATLHAAFYTL